jgi:hypothetical protein
MGDAVSKNGWLTQVVEVIPGGGLITAPFHFMGGNVKEGAKALVKGTISVTTVAVGLEFGLLGSTMIDALTVVGTEVPFACVSAEGENGAAVCTRIYNKQLTNYISVKPHVFTNKWGFALSVDEEGNLSHRNKNKCLDGWEGWVI